MKKIGFLVMLLLVISFAVANTSKKQYEDGQIKCSFETKQGRFHGHYVSFYKNGQKKAEGYFEHNMRSGKWSAWDSTGKLMVQRNYQDPFTMVTIFPETSKEKPIELLNIPRYSMKKNKDHYIEHFEYNERMVVYDELFFRILKPAENPLLFEDNKLIKIIHRNLIQKSFVAYNDEFMTQELSQIPNTENLQVIAYRIKEMTIFDNERFVLETRIIGLCPIFENMQNKDTVSLFWLYYPEMRKGLAKEVVQNKDLPANILTFEDLFFFRYFHSIVYQPDPIWGKKPGFKEIWSAIEQETARVEIEMIEKEHDLWMRFGR